MLEDIEKNELINGVNVVFPVDLEFSRTSATLHWNLRRGPSLYPIVTGGNLLIGTREDGEATRS